MDYGMLLEMKIKLVKEKAELHFEELGFMWVVKNQEFAGVGFSKEEAFKNLLGHMRTKHDELKSKDEEWSKENRKMHKALWNY